MCRPNNRTICNEGFKVPALFTVDRACANDPNDYRQAYRHDENPHQIAVNAHNDKLSHDEERARDA